MRTGSWVGVLGLLSALAVCVSYGTAPQPTDAEGQVDALVILGSPVTNSGAMSPMQYWRVREAVNEYRRGRAIHLLFTGGAAANRFVEAEAMAEAAIQMGIPAAAVVTETTSTDTLENIRNSEAILQAHNWRSIEVISSADHLPRAGVLLRYTDLQWTLHAAPVPFRPWWKTAIAYVSEAVATTLVRWFGLRSVPVIHAVTRWVNARVLPMRVAWKAITHS